MSANGAYGSGKAGAPFDPIAFIKKPEVILRIVSWVFAIIVFGCISAEGWYAGHCQMNDDSNACGYATGIGVIAFLGSIIFLVLDAMFENLSSVQHRKYVVIADLVFSGLWSFLWFVGFCYMCDAWRKTPNFDSKTQKPEYVSPTGRGYSNIDAAIAFTFFSVLSWGGLTFLAVRKYRMGVTDAFASGYDPDPNAPSPYSSFPGSDTGEPYQQPPFTGQKEAAPDYSQPTY